ncbi:hypothetical protein QEN19_001197 [Hanseniaspora menglaensis]
MSVQVAEAVLSSADQDDEQNIDMENINSKLLNDNAVWVADSFSNSCLKCNSQFFPFFNGKHHCRLCGLLFCNECCGNFLYYQSKKIKPLQNPLELNLDIGPYRTCNGCFDEFKRTSLVKSTPYSTIKKLQLKKDEECPVCGKSKTKAGHGTVEECLLKTEENYQKTSNTNNRMLIYAMSADEINKHKEASKDDFDCPICFEDFEEKDKVGRLECLCLYHYDCIKSWFDKKKSKSAGNQEDLTVKLSRNWCPVHDALS